jgi:hypothetical protein
VRKLVEAHKKIDVVCKKLVVKQQYSPYIVEKVWVSIQKPLIIEEDTNLKHRGRSMLFNSRKAIIKNMIDKKYYKEYFIF